MPRHSFGCLSCRRRRVKCDEAHGGCTRCKRYGTPCPGYPDPFDVMLRPQNAQTISSRHVNSDASTRGRKPNQGTTATCDGTRVNKSKPDASSATKHSRLTTTSTSAEIVTPESTLARHIPGDPDQLALAMYYSSNCVALSRFYSLDYVQRLGNGCLFAAIRVLGIAAQSKTWLVRSEILTNAYSRALRLLNLALASSEESLEDSTLLATLIISGIEVKAYSNCSLDDWEAHNNGAVTLISLRGGDQVLSHAGSSMLLQVYSQVILNCILKGKPVPQELYNLRSTIQPYVTAETHPVWQSLSAMLRLADFIAAVRLEDVELDASHRVISDALEIYKESHDVFEHAGVDWQYRIDLVANSSGIAEHQHYYHSRSAANLWCMHQLATIILLNIVALLYSRFSGNIGSRLSPLSAPEAIGKVNQAAKDAIASVPQFLALYHEDRRRDMSQSLENRDNLHPGNHSGGHTPVFRHRYSKAEAQSLPYMQEGVLHWSLFFAARCKYVEPGIRQRALEILRTVGNTLPHQHWKVLAREVRS